MIHSFANKQTEEIFHGIHAHEIHKSFPSNTLKLIEGRLDLLNGADSYESLCLVPSIRSEVVRDAHGKCSLPVEGSWRLCFRWGKEGPFDVELKS